MKRSAFAALAATALAAAGPSARLRAAGLSLVSQEMQWAGVPGASLAMIRDTSVAAAHFGVRDAATRAPVTADTIFEAASLSKPVFAFAVLALVRAGKLDLDRSLDAYLPQPYPIADPRGKAITARHVLTHTSGLANWRHAAGEPLKLHFSPGTRYRYSGEGFYFLQTVEERITGRSTSQFMRAALDRLGMRRSSYVWRRSYARDAALPYGLNGRPLRHDTALLGDELIAAAADTKPLSAWTVADALAALPRLRPPRAALPWNAMPNAAWSLLTTGSDYARFVQALLQHPDDPMLRPAVRVGRYVWRGLGIALQKRGAALSFFHTGANPGFKAVMFGDLRAKRGVVSFTNSDGGFPFNMHVVERVLGDQPAVFDLEQP